MQPNGANKNIVDHAIFSNEGPNLKSPADTKIPKVIPKIYKLKKRKNKYTPRSNIEIPNLRIKNKNEHLRISNLTESRHNFIVFFFFDECPLMFLVVLS